MPKFKLERELPPLEITLDLLRAIENMILQEVKPLSTSSDNNRASTFAVVITDAFGSEELLGIDEFRPALLPDSTTVVDVKYRSGWGLDTEVRHLNRIPPSARYESF
jgi:hypothetical protein